jgi:multidrug resistance efflux pump
MSVKDFWQGQRDGDKKPGLVAREKQLAAAKEEARQYRAEDTGSGVTGNVALKQQLTSAQRALKRQQQLAKGEYPSGQ